MTRSRRVRTVSAALAMGVGAVSSAGAQAPPPRWTLTPELRIGSETAGPEYQFAAPGAVAVNSKGVFVAIRPAPATGPVSSAAASAGPGTGNAVIRQFDLQGKFVRGLGRQGQGPGEFSSATPIGVLGDTLYVIDGSQRRTTLFGPDGAVVSSITWAPRPTGPTVTPSPSTLLSDGTTVGGGSLPADAAITAVPIFRMNRAGVVSDTVAMQSIQRTALQFPLGTTVLNTSQPFRDGPLSAMIPALGRVALVDRASPARGSPATFRVTEIAVSGDTVFSRAYPYTAVPLEASAVDSAVGVIMNSIRTAAARSGGNVLPEAQVRAALYLPAYRVPFSTAAGGTDGTIWLRHMTPAGAPEQWTVVGATGDLVGTVVMPARTVMVLGAADTVWGWERDADDVPTLVRFRVTRP